MTTPPRRFTATKSHSLSGDGVRRLLAAYKGRYAAVVPDFKMQPGMLYTQVRAISARINQNYDAWPSEELKKSYHTFLGKPVFVNHANFDPEKARGRVVAARYIEKGADKYVEVIQEIDAQRFPKLAKEIHEGGLDSVSMGVEAGFTKCSVCDNRATDMSDMCDHVKHHKGEYLPHKKTGEKTLVYENCYKLGFFELSYVFDPADETAVVSRVVVANNRQGYIPTREELALADAKEKARAEKLKKRRQKGPGPVRRIIRDFTDPNSVLDSLERDRKVQQYKEKYRQYPELRAASIVNDYDWADLGRRARAMGAPIQAAKHPEIAAILANLNREQASIIQNQYAQGWKRAATRRTAEEEQPRRKLEENSTMQELGNASVGELPYAPTSYNVTPGAPAGGSGYNGGSNGSNVGSGNYSTAVPGGGAPSQSLTEAFGRAGIDPAMYPLLSGFSVAEGNNPSGAPTLGFTDSQAGTTLDSHAQALAQQLQDRQSVAGPFPHNGSPAEQASWMATVVGQNGVQSDWQGNAQPARSDYVNRIVQNMPKTGKAGQRMSRRRFTAEEPLKKKPQDTSSTMSEMGNMQMGDLPYAPTSYNVTPGAPAGGGTTSGGSGTTSGGGGSGGTPDGSGILPNARPLYDTLMQQFPGADIGGYRVDSFHEHDHGALDFMHPTDPNKVMSDAFAAGAPYVLWQQQQWNADGSRSPMEDRGDPTQNHFDHIHIAPITARQQRRLAWGEVEAPEDIDTLREQSEDDGQDNFHHYVESPEELRTPDFDQAKMLDRAQEQEGLDADRRVEDIEEVGAPAPEGGKMARNSRRRYADDMGGIGMDPAMMGGGMGGGALSPQDELALLNQAEGDLNYAETELMGGDPMQGGYQGGYDESGYEDEGGYPADSDEDGGEEDWDYDDEGQPYDDDEGQPDGDHDEDDGYSEDEDADEEDDEDDEQGGLPPQLAYNRPVRNTASQRNVRRTQKGRPMGINLSERGRFASRGRRFLADDNGYTDGGPYGRNDLGEQEEVHISDQFGGDGVPAEETVANPSAGDSISNTENTLVARVQRGTEQLRRDAAALAMLRQRKASMYRHADDNIIEPTTVNPPLSGTDDQSLKGDDFDNVALDNVATQPKDASIHAFAAFDDWLARSTGKTARQHGNANFIRREAARYIRATGLPLNNLFPTLEKVLVEARKAETKKEATMRRHADEALDTAAPGDRIDVEAPVKNVTDAEAQASQYALSDYANNAGDNIASPDLSTDSQIWAPGEGTKTSNRMADAVAAVRCAEAYINAGLAPQGEKWQLIARFQTMRHATVVDRTRLLEQVAENNAASRQRSAAVSRGTKGGIPQGLGSGQRTAQTYRAADNDPSNDSLLFFK